MWLSHFNFGLGRQVPHSNGLARAYEIFGREWIDGKRGDGCFRGFPLSSKKKTILLSQKE